VARRLSAVDFFSSSIGIVFSFPFKLIKHGVNSLGDTSKKNPEVLNDLCNPRLIYDLHDNEFEPGLFSSYFEEK
jgi:hypothetical protein